MATWRTWRERWQLRRRLRAIEEGVWSCLKQPSRIPEVCRALGIGTGAMGSWLEALQPSPGGREEALGLRPRPFPATAPVEEVSPWKIPSRKPHDPAQGRADRVRRLIHLFLELPLARRDPALASDFILQIAHAAARDDPDNLERLNAALGWLRCATAPFVKTGRQIRTGWSSEDWSEQELVRPLADSAQARLGTLRQGALGPLIDMPHSGHPRSNKVYREAEQEAVALSALAAESEATKRTEHFLDWGRKGTFEIPGDGLHGAGVPEDLLSARGEEWQAIGAILDVLVGDDRTRHELDREIAYLDSLQSELSKGSTCPQGLADLLVLVHARLHQVTVSLSQQTSLTVDLVGRALRMVASQTAPPVPQMLWSLKQGPEANGRTRPGEPFSEKLDVAWELLVRAGAALLTGSAGLGPIIEGTSGRVTPEAEPKEYKDRYRQHTYSKKTRASLLWSKIRDVEVRKLLLVAPLLDEASRIYAEAFTDLFELMDKAVATTKEQIHIIQMRALGWSEMFMLESLEDPEADKIFEVTEEAYLKSPNLLIQIEARKLLTNEVFMVDPDLAVHLAGAICRDHGTLTWEACLTLANSRARYHRYLNAEDGASWQIRLDARPGHGGMIDIRFAVVEQPLSARFRHRFEAEDLQGRVRILWHLVDYAARLHTSILTLTTAEAGRQVDMREEELWNLIDGEDAGPPAAMEGQTP